MSLKPDRDRPRTLDCTLADPYVDRGELSLSRHLLRLASDDRSSVVQPFLAYRGFRQRCHMALPLDTASGGGFTDMGNVSLVVPAIRAFAKIGGQSPPPHTRV